MKSALNSLNSLVFAGLLATVGASAMAQTSPAGSAPAAAAAEKQRDEHRTMGRHDPAKMLAWIAKRQADLKVKLKITPAQEGAWTSFTAAMQPPAATRSRPTTEQRDDLDKLNTPERIDKMRAMRTQRVTEMNAAMDKRGEATKSLYAALSAEQQKIFDAEQITMARHAGRGHHDGGMHRRG